MKKFRKVLRITLISLVSLLVVLLVAAQAILRPATLTRILNDLAAEYVEGDVHFDNVQAHVIRSFPFLTVDAEQFCITYPHQRYARFDSLSNQEASRRFSLLKLGTDPEGATDTLAAFRRLGVSLNYMAFLNRSTIHVHKLELERPRIFAHYFDSTAANWDILPLGREADEDTLQKDSKPLPPIVLDRISLSDRPVIIYTNPTDTLYGMFTLRRLALRGKLNTADLPHSRASLELDTLFLSGRLPSDTVALGIHSLRGKVRDRNIRLEAQAWAGLRTGSFGRVRLPISLLADADLPERPKGELEAVLNELHLQVSALNLEGRGKMYKHRDGVTDLDVDAALKDCPLGQLARDFQENFPILKKIDTDAVLTLTATVKGSYGGGNTPAVNARALIPPSFLDYEDFGRRGRLALDVSVTTDNLEDVHGELKRLLVDFAGVRLNATGSVADALGKDPTLKLDATVKARVDSLTRAFTQEMGISGSGQVNVRLGGKARLSQLNMARIGAASLNCDIEGRDLDIRDGRDSLKAVVPHLALNLCTRGNQIDKNIPKGTRVLGLKAEVDSLDVSMGDMYARGGKVLLLAQNTAQLPKNKEDLTPLMGILKVGSLRLKDADGTALSLRDNTETIRVEPATKEHSVPKITVRSKSKSIRARMDANLFGLRDLDFDVTASRHVRRAINRARLDSLRRLRERTPRKEDAFASSDISLSLSQAVKQYARDWDVRGNIGLESARVRMPAFPLKTSLSGVKGSFDNDTLNLRNLTVQSGASDLSAQACLSGLRAAMQGWKHRPLKLKASVSSNYLDVNELMRGYAYYSAYKPAAALEQASDQAVEEAVDVAQLPDSVQSKLLVLPGNLEVDFSLEAAGIKYDSLEVNWAAADVAMRNRTLQITNALAASNMGDIYFEGFYATRSKEDIQAGFDLNLVDITADKVITLFPAVDTLMPLLTTFEGDLNCELAVTTNIDTLMHLVLPSVDGMMRITGKDLGLNQSPQLTKIARLLMFRNKKEAKIDNMSVTGIVRDNVLTVFPFVINVDRYTLAASGTQHLESAFDYHLSVIKSPLILKLGLNVWGPDFDHIHYGLGRARYQSANVPAYARELDNAQVNLLSTIHNIFELGVEKAMEENRSGQFFGFASAPASAAGSGAAGSSAVYTEESLQGMEVFISDIMVQTAARREALKQEVVQLEAQAALPR